MAKPSAKNRQAHTRKQSFHSGFRKGAQASSGEMIWGIHPVAILLAKEADRIMEIMVHRNADSRKISDIMNLAAEKSIAVRQVADIDRECFRNRITPESHQGIVASVRPFETVSFEQIQNRIEALTSDGKRPVVLVLDSIQDPHNLGAILRSALAFGVTGVILPKDRSAPLSGTVAKASAGALSQLDICRVTNISHAIQQLKDLGLWVFGAAGETDQAIYGADFSSPVCLVIGGEEKGIRKLVREQCDFLIAIPMLNQLNSLNASVAAGIMLYEIVRQQDAAEKK